MIYSDDLPEAKKIRAAFAKFGIDMLSYSTIYRAKDSTPSFLLKLSKSKDDELGLPGHIGNATERGIVAALVDQSMPVDRAVQYATDYIEPHLQFMEKEKRERHLKQTESRVETGIDQLRPLGVPDMPKSWYPGSTEFKDQRYFEYKPEWSPVSIKLWADLVYDDQGLMIDIKAPGAAPRPSLIDNYMLQGALYTAANNMAFKTFVALPSVNKFKEQRFSWHDLDDPARHLNRAKHLIGAIGKLLTLGDSVEEIAAYVVPDWNHFRVDGPRAKQGFKEIFLFD